MALMPCPFCGGKAAMGHTRDATYVYCTECNAQAGYSNHYVPELEHDHAVEAWNNRMEGVNP